MTETTGTPAGWYPDSECPGGQRYWDGSAWTEHRTPPPAVVAVPKVAPTPAPTRHLGAGEQVLWEGQSQSLSAKATGGRSAGKYTLTSHYLYFEKGMLSTNAQQVPVSALHDIDIHQSMSQKARNVGDVTVFINRGSTMERVVLESLQDFRDVQRLLNDASHSARAAVLKAQNTQHYGEGSPFQVVSAAAVQPTAAQAAPTAAAPDPIDQIRKLAELRDAGILSPQEFDAKKVEILSRM